MRSDAGEVQAAREMKDTGMSLTAWKGGFSRGERVYEAGIDSSEVKSAYRKATTKVLLPLHRGRFRGLPEMDAFAFQDMCS